MNLKGSLHSQILLESSLPAYLKSEWLQEGGGCEWLGGSVDKGTLTDWPPLSRMDSNVELFIRASQPWEAAVRLSVSLLETLKVLWSFNSNKKHIYSPFLILCGSDSTVQDIVTLFITVNITARRPEYLLYLKIHNRPWSPAYFVTVKGRGCREFSWTKLFKSKLTRTS